MQPPTSFVGRVLYFANVLGDTEPMCLDWTKVGVACSTFFTGVTGFTACVQQVVENGAHTSWGLFGAAIGLHGLSHGAYRMKRFMERN